MHCILCFVSLTEHITLPPLRSPEWKELSAFFQSRHRGRYLRASALGCATAFGFVAACFSLSSNLEAVASWWMPLCAIAIGCLYSVRSIAWRRVVREELRALALSPVCFHCGYSLKGLDVDEHSCAQCPECGKQSRVITLETPARDPSN